MEKFFSPEPAENGSTTTDYGPYRIDTPNDLERLRRQFDQFFRETRKPETFPGLSREKPSPNLDFHILRKIDFTDKEKQSRPRLHCSICQTEKKFYEGAMSVWSDGCPRMIGHDCLADLVGFERAEQRFADYAAWHARRGHIDQITAALPYLKQAIGQVDKFADDPVTRAATAAMRVLRLQMPDLHKHLSEAARNQSGALRVEKKQSSKFQEGGGRAHGQNRYRAETFATLQGRAALLSRADMARPADHAARELKRVYDVMADADLNNIDGEILKAAARRIDEALVEMEKAYGQCQEIFRFWTHENREAICRWVNHPDNNLFWGRCLVTRDGLATEDSYGEGPHLPYRISSVPDLEVVWAMRDAIRSAKPAEGQDDENGN